VATLTIAHIRDIYSGRIVTGAPSAARCADPALPAERNSASQELMQSFVMKDRR